MSSIFCCSYFYGKSSWYAFSLIFSNCIKFFSNRRFWWFAISRFFQIDITIFSKLISRFFQMDFLIVSVEQVMNFGLQIDKTKLNQVKISRFFQIDFLIASVEQVMNFGLQIDKTKLNQVKISTIISNGFLNRYQWNKLWILDCKSIKRSWIRWKYHGYFNWILHIIVWLAIMVGTHSIWLFIKTSIFLIILSG